MQTVSYAILKPYVKSPHEAHCGAWKATKHASSDEWASAMAAEYGSTVAHVPMCDSPWRTVSNIKLRSTLWNLVGTDTWFAMRLEYP